MWSKSTNLIKKRSINREYEPPTKKLISDGDVLIKQLSQKQVNKKIVLEEQLNARSNFYKATELLSFTEYTAGTNTLQDFTKIFQQYEDVEKLKSYGLTDEDIELLSDSRKGEQHMKKKHKNVNEEVLVQKLNEINKLIKSNERERLGPNLETANHRLETELMLSTKPNSAETKLLRFAIENDKPQSSSGVSSRTSKPVHSMDLVKDIEKEMMDSMTYVDYKKIRKKARSLGNQINSIPSNVLVKEPKRQPPQKVRSLAEHSKWDVKEPADVPATKPVVESAKIYSCKPQKFYTIKDGKIVQIGSETSNNNSRETHGQVEEKTVTNLKDLQKLSADEIKQIPRFENYDCGVPSKVLYLKNLKSNVTQMDLQELFSSCCGQEDIVSVKVMNGRMRGQAFVEFTSIEAAQHGLNEVNGVILKDKPVIIQFGKQAS